MGEKDRGTGLGKGQPNRLTQTASSAGDKNNALMLMV
jgi:hypothetical protein